MSLYLFSFTGKLWRKKPKIHLLVLNKSNSGDISKCTGCTEWNYYECNGFYGRFEGRSYNFTPDELFKPPLMHWRRAYQTQLAWDLFLSRLLNFHLYYCILVYIGFPHCKKGWRYVCLFLKPLRMHCFKEWGIISEFQSCDGNCRTGITDSLWGV